MSTHISYQGKDLGKISLDDNNTGKQVFIAKGLETLMTLLSLKPADEIEIETIEKKIYDFFQREYLQRISGFYPT